MLTMHFMRRAYGNGLKTKKEALEFPPRLYCLMQTYDYAPKRSLIRADLPERSRK